MRGTISPVNTMPLFSHESPYVIKENKKKTKTSVYRPDRVLLLRNAIHPFDSFKVSPPLFQRCGFYEALSMDVKLSS